MIFLSKLILIDSRIDVKITGKNGGDDEVRISKIRRLRKGERTRDTIKRVLTFASFDHTCTRDIFRDVLRVSSRLRQITKPIVLRIATIDRGDQFIFTIAIVIKRI